MCSVTAEEEAEQDLGRQRSHLLLALTDPRSEAANQDLGLQFQIKLTGCSSPGR